MRITGATRPMVRCLGCGFNVEHEDARRDIITIVSDGAVITCATCVKCEAVPDLRESYRRGFNACLDAVRDEMGTLTERVKRRKPA